MNNNEYSEGMYTTNQQNGSRQFVGAPQNDDEGMWTPVEGNIQMPQGAKPGVPFVGPDGNIYCLGDGHPTPTMGAIAQNMNNAIPTPSSIIQMTPIVQPIALVPYASQNQPLLQYDPASKPPVEVKTTYKRKPYPVLCVLLAIISILGIVLIMFMNAVGKTAGAEGYSANGLDSIFSTLAFLGIGSSSTTYFTQVLQPLASLGDAFSKSLGIGLSVVAIPVAVILAVITYLYILIKYCIKLGSGKSPRNFSVASIMLIILGLIMLAAGYGIAKSVEAETTIAAYFAGQSKVGVGIGSYITIALGVISLILPGFTNKKAYVVDKGDEDVYIME